MKELRRKSRNRLCLIAALAAAAAVLLGFIFYAAGQRKERGPERVILVSKIIDEKSDFWVQLYEGARMAAAEYGMELQIVGAPKETDVEYQWKLVKEAVSQEPDAILLVPASSTESGKMVELIRREEIPLVLVDSDVDGNHDITVVGTDNRAAGRLQGGYIAGLAGENSQIVIISHVKDSSTAKEREQGIREGLGEFEKNIVEVVYCDSDYDRAYGLMEGLLKKYPQIDIVAGLNEYSAVGAARAVIDSGMDSKIQLVGFDSSLEEIRYLESGLFEGIVIQNPYAMGYLAVEQARLILDGEKTEKFVDSGSKLISADEVHSEENQKVLFLFTED